MISDVLAKAVTDLRAYLGPEFKQTYTEVQRQRVEKVVDEMEAIRKELDAPVDSPFLKAQQTAHMEGGMKSMAGEEEPKPPIVVSSKEVADIVDRAMRK